jgi:hypothetical protein
MTETTVLSGCTVVTMNPERAEYRAGHVVVTGGRIAALWRLDTLPHADIADPVAALVLGAPPPLELLLVQGRPVVEHGRIVTVDVDNAAADAVAASARLLDRAGISR